MKRGIEEVDKTNTDSLYSKAFEFLRSTTSLSSSPAKSALNNTDLITELRSLPPEQSFLLYGLETQRKLYRKAIFEILREPLVEDRNNTILTIDDIHKEYLRQTLESQTTKKPYLEFGRFNNFAKNYFLNFTKQMPNFNLLKDAYIRVGCQLAINSARETGINIYFIVDEIDTKTAINPSISGFTSAELRHIHRLYKEDPELVEHVKLYIDGKEISKAEYFSVLWAECHDDHVDKSTTVTPLKMAQYSLSHKKGSPAKSGRKYNGDDDGGNKARKKLTF
tara:strand:- start:194205 stop:195041 length:837 start_codon:yes stop_codon:yes gene_type:complete